ncbi:MAG TPA: 3-hydroxy-3-methylglutaryl-CoA reductase, partial [Anaerolineales bacterium]
MTSESQGSRLPGFYNLSLAERLAELARRGELTPDELAALSGQAGLTAEQADHMVENAIGIYGLPLGIALNFQVNGRDVLAPMAIEEPSVVAGASFMAKLARAGGGFTAHTSAPEMIAQMQLLDTPDLPTARQAILEQKERLLA